MVSRAAAGNLGIMKRNHLAIVILASAPVFAQPQSAASEFDAAVVKVNKSGETRAQGSRVRGGQLTWINLTMSAILYLSYSHDPAGGPANPNEAPIGGPGWLDSDRFDLVVKSPGDTPVETVRLMLRNLLADRFKLAVHPEERMTDVYALTVGKQGAKVRESTGSGTGTCTPGEGIQGLFHRSCTNMTMAALAEALPWLARGYVDRQVVDRTGLQGRYDFKLDWTPRPSDKSDVAAGATMFDAIEKLGLKLESLKQPMPILVIDHVERVPRED